MNIAHDLTSMQEQNSFDIETFTSLTDPQESDSASKSFLGGLQLDSFISRRASKRQLMIVFRQLSLLIETGIDLAESIELVARTCKQHQLREALEEIHVDINNGASLSLAVAAQQSVLGDQICASLRAGEATGQLTEVLKQIANQSEEELELRSSIIGSLAYPAILCTAALIIAGVVTWFVLPQFEQTFTSMAVDPPLFTQFLLNGAGLVRQNVVVLTLAISVSLGGLVVMLSQPMPRRFISNVCFRSPILGTSLRNLAVGQLFVNLGHLLTHGVSLLEAIRLVRSSARGSGVEQLTSTWELEVLEGRGLSQKLDEFDFLPEGADAMLIMAEKSGKLDCVLTTAGSFYRREGASQLRQILKMSEPAIIILLGVFVGVVVVSVLVPVLDVQSAGSIQ